MTRIKNLAYTAGTDGVIVVPEYGPQPVRPGLVIRPDSLAHSDALRATGYFEDTTEAATKSEPAPDAPTPDAPAGADQTEVPA